MTRYDSSSIYHGFEIARFSLKAWALAKKIETNKKNFVKVLCMNCIVSSTFVRVLSIFGRTPVRTF